MIASRPKSAINHGAPAAGTSRPSPTSSFNDSRSSRLRSGDPHHGSAPEPLSPVSEAQATVLSRLRGLTPLRRRAVAPHLEDVGKVRGAQEIHPRLERRPVLVAQRDPLPHPTPEGAPAHHTDALGLTGPEDELRLRAPDPRCER